MADPLPGLTQSASIVLHNGKAALPIKAGQANVFKAKSGEHYRVLKGKKGEEQLVDNVVAKHAGADLKLEYSDGTQVTLENYYVECKTGDCDVTVPGNTGEGYKISSASTGGAALGDGSTLVYAHGSYEALMGMAQGNAPMQTALGGLKGADITYLPSALEIGSTNPALLGVGGLFFAAAGGGGGGGGGGGSPVAAAVHNLVGGGIVAGPVVAGNGLTVNLYSVDGVTLLGTQKLSDAGTFSIDVGSYTGAVIGKLVDAGAGNDFIDEATGQARDMNANLMAIGVAGSGTTTVNMNALTTIAALKAGAVFAGASVGVITAAVIVQTNAAVANAFGLTDLIGSSVVTTVDATGAANAGFTPAALSAEAKYGAALAALSGMDAANGGDMQATINSLVAGITIAGSTATLSNVTVEAVVLGATTASANTVGTGASSLTAIISTLTAQTSASVSINQIATDGVISASEQNSTISGTTVTGATVSLTLSGNVRAATVAGTSWSYDLTGADIAAMGQGGEVITATSTLTGGGTATATRSAVVDTVGPSVTNVAITSATGIQNSTMNAGDVVSVTVTMSEGTTVTGTPQLSLNIGGTTVLANYASGSGTPYIAFAYTVLANQTDTNGISIGANSLVLNGGTLSDAAGNTATVTHAVVADNAGYLVDNTAPTLATTTYSAAENATAVATLAGTDAGAITYSLGGAGTDNALFSITSGGALTFLTAKNFEALGSAASTNAYAITVNLTDAAGNVRNQAVTVNVTNVNEAPVMTSATTANFAENATGTAYTATATDVDAGTTLTYTIGGTDSALFNINASTGAVTFKAVPDYEAPTDAGANNVYDITVTASDGSLIATQAVAITVTNINEAPVMTSATTANFAENATGTVYTAAATDVDAGTTLTYTIGGTDSALFNINASTGAVTFVTAPNYEAPTDSGANNVYDITVTASDGSLTATQAVAITVTNLNDNAPVFTSGATGTVAENAATSTVIYTAATTDVDNLAARTYTVSGTDAGLVDITSAGVVTLKASADYESKTSYSFNVIANDGANTTTQAVVVSVTNLNDNAPVFTSIGTGTVAENAVTSTVIYTAATSDADNLAARTYTVSGTDAGLVDITSAGVVTLKAAADYESKTSYSFNVIANDGANNTTQAVVVSVTNVNEAPVITSAATASFAENGTGAVYTAAATDVDAGTTLAYTIGGTDNALFNINASTGAVTFKTAPNFEAPSDAGANNVYDITVTASDGSLTATQAVAITVTNVNDNAPVFTSGGTGTVAENAATSTVIYTAATTDADNLAARTYTVSGTDAGLVDITSAGVVTLKASADYESKTSYSFNVIANDGANNTTQAVVVSVTNVNDNAPVFTSGATGTVAENAATSTVIYTATTTDADNLAARTYTVSGTDAGLVDITAAGVVTLKASADYESKTSYSFNVIANDGANNTTQAVVVSVTNVNEAPVITSAATASFAENGTGTVYTAAATDVDAGTTLTYTLGGTDAAKFAINSGTGVVTFVTAPNYEAPTDSGANNVYDITVTATDNGSGSLSATKAVAITVTNVNEAPVITSAATASFAENGTGTVYTAAATDVDAGTTLTYTLGGTDAAKFAINSGTGVVTFVTAPNYEAPTDSGANNVYDITVTATDNGSGSLSATKAVAITVTNVNEAPAITSGLMSTSVFEAADAAATTSTAYTLLAGQTAQGTLTGTGDADWYKVYFNAGQQYTFAMTGAGASNVQDTLLELYNSSGVLLTANDDGLPGKNSTFSYTPNASGYYYIGARASAPSDSGAYVLTFTSGSSPSFDAAMGAGVIDKDLSWSPAGAPVAITYGFRQSWSSAYSSTSNLGTFSQLTVAEISAVRSDLQFWSDICGITFTEVNPGGYTNSATMLIGNYSDATDGAGAFAYYPNTANTSFASSDGDLWLNLLGGISSSSLPIGSFSLYAILHEIGHAIGLSHPGLYNAAPGVSLTYANNAQFVQDSYQYSTMSYFNGTNTGAFSQYYSTPMMFDILAAQNIYGVNTSTRATDTIYGFDSTAGSAYLFSGSTASSAFCIWDGGGTDTIDASGFAQNNQLINLCAGTFSDVGGLMGNVSIAIGCSIENAKGGSSSDVIFGNSLNNTITGGAGNDMLFGGAGSDTAIFSSALSNYVISSLTDGWSVVGTDGTDQLFNFEFARFSDQTITLAANSSYVITSYVKASFAENGTGTVYTAAATDVDAGTTLTYSLGGTDASLFNISSSGAITFRVAPNYEAPADAGANYIYNVTVTASDGVNFSDAQEVAITVTNVNEAPVFTSGATASFAENGTGTVYTAAATDVDAGTTLTYTLGGTDAAKFAINSGTGVVTFVTAPNYEAPTDSGANNVYDITVTATDNGSGSLSATKAVAITVTNVNEAPVFTSGATASFAENGTGTVYTATATDVDAGTTLTYTLGGTDAAKFAINSGTGVVTFVTAPNYEAPTDSGANNVYDITVTATDNGSGSLSATKTVAITVTNVGEAGDSSIDLGTYGKLIAPVQVDGGQWYYFWDRSGNGTSANSGTLNGSVDYTTHDVLDAIFNQDINGVVGGGGNTTDTYRYATINGVHLALPKFGSQAVLPTTQNYISSQGTSIGSGSIATNNTYDDLLAVWDAYNGTGTQTNISGTPTGWQSAYYWSATVSNLGHALVGLSTGDVWNYPDTNNYYVALQVL